MTGLPPLGPVGMSEKADAEEYFKAVKDGELQKVKEFLKERKVKVDTSNKVIMMNIK